MKRIIDFNFSGKRVLVRCDFNVPLKKGKILDDFRIRKTLPTIEFLTKKKAKVILISHLGDPNGKVIEELRLDPIAKRLRKLLKKKVLKLNECLGDEVKKATSSLKEGEILILENVRFYPQEEENDLSFAKEISELGEIFINEAFSVSHRAHASIVGIPKFLPSGIGLLFEKEISFLENFLKEYKRPLVTLIGGKKIKDKAPLVEKFLEIGDKILINHLIAKEIKEGKVKVKFPEKILSPIDGVDKKGEHFDIGPKTIKIFSEEIMKAKTIVWNGPFGKIEEKKYQRGTREIAKSILKSKAISLIGGGETIEFTNKLRITEKFSFASTGGGAFLNFLAGKRLPGLEVLGYYGN
jgi:3-phosphoglycerate kinase